MKIFKLIRIVEKLRRKIFDLEFKIELMNRLDADLTAKHKAIYEFEKLESYCETLEKRCANQVIIIQGMKNETK